MNTTYVTPVSDLGEANQRFLRSSWFAVAVIGLLTLILLGLLSLPVKRIAANVQVNYNEGWNAYRQQMTIDGVSLYGSPPGRLTGETGYPPVSFHLVGWLGRMGAGCTAAGRWLSLLSLLATGIFVGLIVSSQGGGAVISLLSFLLFEIGISVFFPSRRGMNDPELLGLAITTAGLYCYVRNPTRSRLIFISAALFCLAGFTKQTMLAFPAAVAIDLLIRSRQLFVPWAGAMIAAAGLLSAFTFLINGRFVLVHWLVARSYSYTAGWHNIIHEYLLGFQGLLIVGAVWAISTFRFRRVFVLAFVISHILAFLLAGTEGIDLNICFNAFAAAVIASGLALTDLNAAIRHCRTNVTFPGFPQALAAALAMTLLINVPGQLREDLAQSRALASSENEFRSVVNFVKMQPGSALCDSLLVCYEAGKPYEFYSLFVRDQIRTGALKEGEVLELIRNHRFKAIQVPSVPSDGGDPRVPRERRYLTRNFIQELFTHYRIGMQTPEMLVYIPK
jgi:hypothetical protein